MLTIEPHPLLDLYAFTTEFPAPLGDVAPIPDLPVRFKSDAATPMHSSDAVRKAVRDLLRYGGFKPAGRSKPASEYLQKAAADETLASINVAVDACNIVSLHSGLPISVVDLDKTVAPLRVAVAPEGSSYVFNASGQVIDVAGLLCLFDAEGPCANAVKDAQRTKTDTQTRRTLSLIWGANALTGRTAEAEGWYRSLLEQQGAATERVFPAE